MYQYILDDCYILHRQREPMVEHTINRHIEYCWLHDPPMGYTAGRPELRGAIPVLPGDHLLVLPEFCQDSPHLWAQPVPLQGLQESDAV